MRHATVPMLSLLVALACGCSSPPVEQAGGDPPLACTKEAPMGSNRLVTVCRSAAQVQAERAEAERAAGSIQRSVAKPAGGSGG